jgi:hypothetical protein
MNKSTTEFISRAPEPVSAGLNRPFARLMVAFLLALILEISVSASALAQVTKAAGLQTPLLMDRQKEVSLALSACPSSVADKAAVYVLEKSGYVKVRESQNGFTAIVQHAAPTSQEPQCMDSEGARTFLPRILKVAELRSQGKSSAEIQAFVSDAVAKGTLPTPTRPGVIYMLSSQNLLPNGKGEIFPPHVMFYGTHLTNADLGVDGKDLGPDGNPKGPAFVAGEGSPYSLIIVPIQVHSGQDHASADKPSGGSQ